MITKVTDTTEEADEIEADMEEKLSSLEEKVAEIEEPKSVYVEISPSPETFTAGKGTFIDTILERINAERSEEHTSELQSRGHLVCRLLLEKKKTNNRKKD